MEGRTDIGGFFGLELPEYGNFPQWHHGRSVAVNSGRRALEYILRRLGDVRRVHVPLYTCGTVLEPMERLHIPVIPYRIDGHLEPEELRRLPRPPLSFSPRGAPHRNLIEFKQGGSLHG